MRLIMKKAFARVLEGIWVDVRGISDSIPDWGLRILPPCAVSCLSCFFALFPGERKLSVVRRRRSDAGAVDGLSAIETQFAEAHHFFLLVEVNTEERRCGWTRRE